MTPPRPHLPPFWQWPTLANLLAPAVACAWMAGLAMVHRLYVPSEYYILLALTVWLIYTLDGLLDARDEDGPGSVLSPRAHFHRALSLPLSLLMLAVSLGGAWMAWRNLSGTLVIAAGILALPILLYLSYAQSLRYSAHTLTFLPKEILAGMLFAMGVMLPLLDLQGQFFLASPDKLIEADAEGPIALIFWALKLLLFIVHQLFRDSATFLIGSLFATNCLLTALGESDEKSPIDPGSARHTTPRLARLAPVFAASLLASSVINGATQKNPHNIPIMFMVGLAAALMLAVHMLRTRRHISGPAAAVLFDVALLLPVGIMPFLFNTQA